MNRGFWDTLQKPIIGLAPMDGVTDAPFRYIMDKYGHPSILFTEFTSVEGLVRGVEVLLDAFIYHDTSIPTVAQVFGSNPESFYKVAFIVAELGFDGMDINMGCPDKNVSKRGGGAGLILQPETAKKIVRECKRAMKEWSEGKKIEDVGVPENIIHKINLIRPKLPKRFELPISVKTRIGYDKIVTKWWIETLLTVEPANISLHGRTLKQLYTGRANWDEIALAASLTKHTKTTLLGNGDIHSLEDAKEKIKMYGVDGVLIGRATYGNPWFFTGEKLDTKKLFQVAIEHCEIFHKLLPKGHFISMRKHLAWYCRGFEGAGVVRNELVKVKNTEEVKKILNSYI